jgi:hypothetical protein
MIKTKLSTINNLLTKFGLVLVIRIPSDKEGIPTVLWIERFSKFQERCRMQNEKINIIKTP